MISIIKSLILNGLKKNVLILILILFLNIFVSFISLIQPLAFKTLFDEVLPDKDLKLGIIYITIVVLAPVLFTLINSLIVYFTKDFGNKIAKTIRMSLFKQLLDIKVSVINKIGKGEIINRLTSQVGQLTDVLLANILTNITSNIILLAITLTFMLSMSVKLTFLSMLAFPTFILLFKKVKKYTNHLQTNYFQLLDKGVNYLNDLFLNLKSVHVNNGQQYEVKRWEKWNKEVMSVSKKTDVFHNLIINLFSDLIISIMMGIIYGYSLFLIIKDDISIGTLLAFIVILPRLFGIFRTLFTTTIDFNKMKLIVDNLNEVLNEERIHSGKVIADFSIVPRLQFSNVSFSYGDIASGIRNFNLAIEPGMFVGIVGVSGSGKTTLFELIHKSEAPTSGTITINDINIAEYDTLSIREYIGYNQQSSILWNRTILDNILYPKSYEELSDHDINMLNRVIHIAKLEEVIEKLPNGLGTLVIDHGSNFSGGEIQRILLARALMKDTKMLLLDEYTSALDAITENSINETLNDIKGTKTIIVVAHRLSTIKNADYIVVVDKGEVIEAGTLHELIEKNGVFKKMYDIQRF